MGTQLLKALLQKEETGNTTNKQCHGHLKSFNDTKLIMLVREVDNNPYVSSQTLSRDIATKSGAIVTPRTIRNDLNEVDNS